MVIKKFWIFFLLVITALTANQEITITLQTESPLKPLFLQAQQTTSAFNPNYLQSLQEIMLFDLNHNGMTYVTDQAQGFAYSVTLQLKGSTLTAIAIDNGKKLQTPILGMTVIGELAHDRTVIHKIADAIHKVFFGEEGISSLHFLYTNKVEHALNRKPVAEVWQADYDGANAVVLTAEKSLCVNPVYLPAKPGYLPSYFAYVSYRQGQPKIYISSLKNQETAPALAVRGNQFMPTFTKECDKIAFVCDVAGNPDLFIQTFNTSGPIGKPRQIFSAPRSTQASPSFSPDGQHVAFVSNKDGHPRIYVMPLPAANTDVRDLKPQLISKSSRENTTPVWSPDGTKLAYSSMHQGIRQIWIYDFKTKKEWPLTTGSAHKENPSWAPNSLHLLYNSASETEDDIYLIDLNGQQATKVLSGKGIKRFPSWEPRTFNSAHTAGR